MSLLSQTTILGDIDSPLSLETSLIGILQDFKPVSLEEIAAYQLEDRVDTKFILSSKQLLELVPFLNAEFQVLKVATYLLQPYDNLYYDTPDFQFYHMHHNGQTNRNKVRERHYQSTGERFLEVKHKNNKGRTIKERIPLSNQAVTTQFLEQYLSEVEALTPVLGSSYKRISLISNNHLQRLTLDFDLSFTRPAIKAPIILQNLAIAEFKQGAFSRNSGFDDLRRQFQLRPTAISKYCIGCSLHYPFLKQNRFKPTLHLIRKLHDS